MGVLFHFACDLLTFLSLVQARFLTFLARRTALRARSVAGKRSKASRRATLVRLARSAILRARLSVCHARLAGERNFPTTAGNSTHAISLHSFASQPGSVNCTQCAIDSYAPQSGMSICLPCPNYKYQNQNGGTTCVTVRIAPSPTLSLILALLLLLSLQCDGNQYLVRHLNQGLASHSCLDCPTGAQCQPNTGAVIASDNTFLMCALALRVV